MTSITKTFPQKLTEFATNVINLSLRREIKKRLQNVVETFIVRLIKLVGRTPGERYLFGVIICYKVMPKELRGSPELGIELDRASEYFKRELKIND